MTGGRVWEEPWPVADPAMLARDEIELVVQINGKLVDRLPAAADAPEDELEELARGSEQRGRPGGRPGDRQGSRGSRQAREPRGQMSERRIPLGPLVGTLGAALLAVSLFLDW